MKKIKILLLISLMTFSCKSSTFTTTSSSKIRPLDQQIQRIINSAPELKIYDETIVKVKFRLNADSKIIVISDNSDNYEITKFIKTTLTLKKLNIENKNNNRIYSVPVKFLQTVD